MPEQHRAGEPNLRAADVMRPSVAIGEQESVHAAWELMRRGGLAHVPVVRYGRTVGLLDDPALLLALVHAIGDTGGRRVGDVASDRWLAVRSDDDVRSVYERLVRRGVAAAVVVDGNGSPIGVVTRDQALDALHTRR